MFLSDLSPSTFPIGCILDVFDEPSRIPDPMLLRSESVMNDGIDLLPIFSP